MRYPFLLYVTCALSSKEYGLPGKQHDVPFSYLPYFPYRGILPSVRSSSLTSNRTYVNGALEPPKSLASSVVRVHYIYNCRHLDSSVSHLTYKHLKSTLYLLAASFGLNNGITPNSNRSPFLITHRPSPSKSGSSPPNLKLPARVCFS